MSNYLKCNFFLGESEDRSKTRERFNEAFKRYTESEKKKSKKRSTEEKETIVVSVFFLLFSAEIRDEYPFIHYLLHMFIRRCVLEKVFFFMQTDMLIMSQQRFWLERKVKDQIYGNNNSCIQFSRNLLINIFPEQLAWTTAEVQLWVFSIVQAKMLDMYRTVAFAQKFFSIVVFFCTYFIFIILFYFTLFFTILVSYKSSVSLRRWVVYCNCWFCKFYT